MARIFGLIGGHVALDFVNTVDWRGDSTRREELLPRFEDLVAWGVAVKLLRPRDARAFTQAAQRNKGQAERSLRRARRLREVLARVLIAAAGSTPPTARDLRLFNAFLAAALRKRRLHVHGTTYVWSWDKGVADSFDVVLWPVVLAAADLLASEHRTHIHVCGAPACGWLFLDTSRNQRRRWCSMKGCGNRAKARRFYQRARDTSANSPGAS
jgi:predicted RNA-binding Zn ribbon-like protein